MTSSRAGWLAVLAAALAAGGCFEVKYADCEAGACAAPQADASCEGGACSRPDASSAKDGPADAPGSLDARVADTSSTDVAADGAAACPGGVCPDAGDDAAEPDAAEPDVGPSCAESELACGGRCVDPKSDPAHCGECGKACPDGDRCTAGVCELACPPGANACGGRTCLDLATDAKNCGACGKTCADTEDCVAGTCVTACRARLRQPIADGWGTRWDGLERAADTQAAAELACTGIGGRLPTPTEMFRVSATQSATVGQTSHVNYLWSGAPRGPGQGIIVRLSDGLPAVSDATVARRNYRCVCPGSTPTAFTGNACHGPPNAPCFALSATHNMDIEDRVPLPKVSAMWECAQARGRIAESLTYIEAIQQQLPNGTSRWLYTADEGNYQASIVVKWMNTQPIWTAAGNVTAVARTELRPFRCVGLKTNPGPHPRMIDGQFVGTTSLLKGDGADNPAQPWALAHDTCAARGGHLARTAELGELVMQGLPGGSARSLWTADEMGYNGTQFLVGTLAWMGVAPTMPYFYTAATTSGVTWAYKTTAAGYPFRCLYYPVDTTYRGPAEADCQGGCMRFTAKDSPATLWVDQMDRPRSNLESAIFTCRSKGGHLASTRDLTEAIRQGLPNGAGTGAYVMTWDIGLGDGTAAGINPKVVTWTGEERTFTDQHPRHGTWVTLAASHPFRCMWTNELR